MEMVAREAKDPMATEFRRVVREVGLIPHQDAMHNMLRRVPATISTCLVPPSTSSTRSAATWPRSSPPSATRSGSASESRARSACSRAQAKLSGYIISRCRSSWRVIFVMNNEYMSAMFVMPWICMPDRAILHGGSGFSCHEKIADIEV
jgi:tight adherence protein B